jgi:hypothetical protein
MRTKNLIILFFALSLAFYACKEDQMDPIEGDSSAPGALTNPKVENLPGGAKITYTLPQDPDLLYAEAVYLDAKGIPVKFKSSYYTNNIFVEGFADSLEHEVEIYAVDRSGNRSTGTRVAVQPKTPPYMATLKSIEVKPDFGGISVSFVNETKAQLAIEVLTPDSSGTLKTAYTFYTQRDRASFSVRGFASEPRKFFVQVSDKWKHRSDPKETQLTPIYEQMLDKSKFREVKLPGDARTDAWGGKMQNIWDGKALGDVDNSAAHTGNTGTGVPMYFTFDLGVEAKLSRFNLKMVQDDKHWFNDVSPKKYEVWGTLNPNPDGSFNGWTKLASVENKKPSGLPVGMITEDDRIAGRIGDEVVFASDLPKVRYIRLRCLDNWSGNTNMVMTEVTFWGNDK